MNSISKIVLLSLCVSNSVYSTEYDFNELKSHINYFQVASVTPNLDTNYQTNRDDVRISTVIPGAYSFSLDTTYLTIGLTTNTSSENKIELSDFTDYYLKKDIGDFELTGQYSKFSGGYINEGPLNESDTFYDDYFVEVTHFKLKYYFNTHFNKVHNNVRGGQKFKASFKKSYIGSWSVSLGHDKSSSKYPNLAASDFTNNFVGITQNEYVQSLESEGYFYSFGYQGVHLVTSKFSYLFSLSMGNGPQNISYRLNGERFSDSKDARYVSNEIGLNYLAFDRHNWGIYLDQYTYSTDISVVTLNRNYSSIQLYYQYLL